MPQRAQTTPTAAPDGSASIPPARAARPVRRGRGTRGSPRRTAQERADHHRGDESDRDEAGPPGQRGPLEGRGGRDRHRRPRSRARRACADRRCRERTTARSERERRTRRRARCPRRGPPARGSTPHVSRGDQQRAVSCDLAQTAPVAGEQGTSRAEGFDGDRRQRVGQGARHHHDVRGVEVCPHLRGRADDRDAVRTGRDRDQGGNIDGLATRGFVAQHREVQIVASRGVPRGEQDGVALPGVPPARDDQADAIMKGGRSVGASAEKPLFTTRVRARRGGGKTSATARLTAMMRCAKRRKGTTARERSSMCS